MASYTETIYHPVPEVADARMACNHKTYATFGAGVLCRDRAAHRSYEETI